MRSYPNIDKIRNRRGEYIGYANGVWRIRRGKSGWQATKPDDEARVIRADTLAALSVALEQLSSAKAKEAACPD